METFCVEAAVLLLVFPLLDEFVQHGRQSLSLKLIVASLGASAFFLAMALAIAIIIKTEER